MAGIHPLATVSTADDGYLSPPPSFTYDDKPTPPTLSLPMEPKDSASPALYFKTLVKIIRFVRLFFAYVAKKTFKTFKSLPNRILDFLVLHFPKMSNFRNTLKPNIDPNILELQLADKSERHADNLRTRLDILRNLLKTDGVALQKGEINLETHLMRYLQIAAMLLADCLDEADPYNPEHRIPLPYPYLQTNLDLNDVQNSYTIDLKINYKGLVAHGLEPPEDSYAPPLLLIKGTSTTNLSQIQADLNENIGSKIFEANSDKLYQWIRRHTETKVIVTGHSLGGTIAKIVGCMFHALIQTIVPFDAPSPGAELVTKFKKMKKKEEEKTKALEEPQIPTVCKFIFKGSLVSYLGGPDIPGSTLELEVPDILTPKDQLSRPYTITLKNRHSYPFILTPAERLNYLEFETNQITDQIFLEDQKIERRRLLRMTLETARWAFSFFLTWAVRFLAKKQTRTLTRSVQMRRFSFTPSQLPSPSARRYSMY